MGFHVMGCDMSYIAGVAFGFLLSYLFLKYIDHVPDPEQEDLKDIDEEK